jgi:hypothetical protein
MAVITGRSNKGGYTVYLHKGKLGLLISPIHLCEDPLKALDSCDHFTRPSPAKWVSNCAVALRFVMEIANNFGHNITAQITIISDWQSMCWCGYLMGTGTGERK